MHWCAARHIPLLTSCGMRARALQAGEHVPGQRVSLQHAGPLLLELLPHLWTGEGGGPGGSGACCSPACQEMLSLAAWFIRHVPPACPHPPQDWSPGEYVRWYIDGHFLYEVNKEALRAQTNSTGALLAAT